MICSREKGTIKQGVKCRSAVPIPWSGWWTALGEQSVPCCCTVLAALSGMSDGHPGSVKEGQTREGNVTHHSLHWVSLYLLQIPHCRPRCLKHRRLLRWRDHKQLLSYSKRKWNHRSLEQAWEKVSLAISLEFVITNLAMMFLCFHRLSFLSVTQLGRHFIFWTCLCLFYLILVV